MPQAGRRQADLMAQSRRIRTAQVAHLDPFEIVPGPFLRVEIGCVAGKAFQMDTLGRPRGQKLLDHRGAVNGRAVPHHQQLAGDVHQEMLEKTYHVGTPATLHLGPEKHPPIQRNAADGREMIAGQGHTQDWRLSAGSIAAHDGRQEIEAGLVYPDEGTPFVLSLFLRAGQRSARHLAIAASSRWLARWTGFWLVQPRARMRRRTCVS
jgi:hypothetical protein